MDARDLYAYTVRLRWRVLEALRAAPTDALQRDMGTNHRSILNTLIHIMAVEESWIHEDIERQPATTWQEFRDRYLAAGETLDSVIAGWHEVTRHTVTVLSRYDDLDQPVLLAPPGPEKSVTVAEIISHLATEELIHMGEVLAMTRQQRIDLPSYFLMSVMDARDHPWEEWRAEATREPA